MKEKKPTLPDARYTANREYCGSPIQEIVVRFCGDYIGQCETTKDAETMASKHRKRFLRNAGIEG